MANASALASLLGNGMVQQPNGLITPGSQLPGALLGSVPFGGITPPPSGPIPTPPSNITSPGAPTATPLQANQDTLAPSAAQVVSSPNAPYASMVAGMSTSPDALAATRDQALANQARNATTNPDIAAAVSGLSGSPSDPSMRQLGGSSSFNEASPTGTPASGSAKSAGGIDSTPIVLTSANQNDPATISTWLQQHGISAADVPYWTQQIQGTGSPGLGDGTYWANKIANPGSSSSSGSGLPSLLSGLTTTLPDMSGNVAQTQGLSDPTLAGATSSDINAAGGQNAQLMQLLSLLQGQAK